MFESPDAVCPYYRRHNGLIIKCEGRGNQIDVKNIEDAERHIKTVCGDFLAWGKCPIAVRLNEKYK